MPRALAGGRSLLARRKTKHCTAPAHPKPQARACRTAADMQFIPSEARELVPNEVRNLVAPLSGSSLHSELAPSPAARDKLHICSSASGSSTADSRRSGDSARLRFICAGRRSSRNRQSVPGVDGRDGERQISELLVG